MTANKNGIGGAGIARSVTFTNVAIRDDFWSPRQKQIICRTILAGIENVQLETGGIPNIINTARMHRGEAYEPQRGKVFVDSDVHKLLEAMCYALQIDVAGDTEILAHQAIIRAKLEEWIPYYQDAQEQDGYFDTFFTLSHRELKWTDFNLHELYCAGHFYEAAVAHYRMTDGKDKRLFLMAIKNADYVEGLFGPGKWKQVPGHQEIELALLKLAILCREIGTMDGVDYAAKAEKYVALAQYFLDTRGDHEGRYGKNLRPDYCQDELPLTQQTQALSHAVRAQYMYTAMVDAMVQSGKDDYNGVLLALWDSVNTKTYAHGGMGVSDHHEGFGPDYYMPLGAAYCETCSSIANLMWNQRMNLLFGESKYADKMETVLHNAMLAGINLDGNRFFYTNVVSTSGRERVKWYGTACCPPNLMRTVLSLGGYIYVQKEDEVRVNLYIGNEAALKVSDGDLKLKLETDFPWDGNVKVTVSASQERSMKLRLRVPNWAVGSNTACVNGESISSCPDGDGYITLDRVWHDGDTVQLYFPVDVQQIPMVEGVEQTKTYTAFRRGLVVYAAEKIDLSAEPRQFYMDEEAPDFTEEWVENLDGGQDTFGLRGTMKIATRDAKIRNLDGSTVDGQLTMVPYYATANRGGVPMELYISKVPRKLPLEYFATPSASHTNSRNSTGDNPKNLNDGNDFDASRWTSYSSRTVHPNPWVEYSFTFPVTIRGCSVKWYDDGYCGGGVRSPNGLTVQYWNGSEFVDVKPIGTYDSFPKNDYGTYEFQEITTQKIRLVMDNSQTNKAVGIMEWKLI